LKYPDDIVFTAQVKWDVTKISHLYTSIKNKRMI